MALQPLDDLDPEEQRVVIQLLRGVVDYPEIHISSFQMYRTRPVDGYEFDYFIGRQSGVGASPIPLPLRSKLNLATAMEGRGYVRKTKQDGWFEFTDEAVAWYRQSKDLTDEDIRRRLGYFLLKQLQQSAQVTYEPLDLDRVAAELQVPRDRLVVNARVLLHGGYVEEGPFLDRSVDDGFIFLTQGKGIPWASNGAHALISVGVSLDQTVKQIQQLPIEEGVKDTLELALRRFDAEETQEELAPRALTMLLSVAGRVRGVAPIIVAFLSDRLDATAKLANRL